MTDNTSQTANLEESDKPLVSFTTSESPSRYSVEEYGEKISARESDVGELDVGTSSTKGGKVKNQSILELSPDIEQRLTALLTSYPNTRSAVMPALYLAQEHFGFISSAAINWVSERLGMPPVQVMEVATFYTMFYKKPVGKYHVQVCRTLSCSLRGAKALTKYLQNRCKVAPREVTSDGLWSYEEVECLGSCGTAPMCEINDRYFENLSPEKLDELMNLIESNHPDLRFSTLKDELGAGLSHYGFSEVISKSS